LPREKRPSTEIIFKNIHSTQRIPMVVSFSKIQTILRLYAPERDKQGRQTPFLKRDTIVRYLREMRRNRNSAGINPQWIGKKKDQRVTLVISAGSYFPFDFFIDFKENGVITLYATKINQPLDTLDGILVDSLKPVLEQLNEYLEPTGFFIPIYKSYLDVSNDSIKVENLSFKMTFEYTAAAVQTLAPTWKSVFQCARSLFLPVETTTRTIQAYFIRISGFKRMNVPAAYVIKRIDDLRGQGSTIRNTIVEELVNTFPEFKNNKPKAESLFEQQLQEMSRDDFDGDVELPGFFTTIELNERNQFSLTCENTASLYYLSILEFYFTRLVEIARNKKDADVLCSFNKGIVENEKVVAADPPPPVESDDSSGSGSDDDDDAGRFQFREDFDSDSASPTTGGAGAAAAAPRSKWSSWILRRLKDQAPLLFNFSEKEDDITGYSRQCQGDSQPVILTQDEKDHIDQMDEQYDKSYTQALEYNVDDKNKYFFICPKYWSISQNRSVSEAELREKNYKIITRSTPEKELVKIPENREHEYVYHFTPHNKTPPEGQPGLFPALKKLLNKNGAKLPCCYLLSPAAKTSAPAAAKPGSNYISEKSPPLEKNHFGYLPPLLEDFFGIDRRNFYNAATKKIRPNVAFVLRFGVENVAHQSFVACFAQLYAYYKNLNNAPSLAAFGGILAAAMDETRFVEYENGQLPFLFGSGDGDAYAHFLQFLADPEVDKTPDYLWDLFSIANPNLFDENLNIIIVEYMTDTDGNDTFRFVCPSNAATASRYDPRNKHVILYKYNQYYEPLIVFKKLDKKTVVEPFFSTGSDTMPGLLEKWPDILRAIHTDLQKCNKRRPQRDRVLPPSLESVETAVPDFTAYVRHWNHKIVGVLSAGVVVPCDPLIVSTPRRKTKSLAAINGRSYDDTFQVLERTGLAALMPRYCIVDDSDLVVGVELETLQFVEILPAIPWDDTMLPVKYKANPLDVERTLYGSIPSVVEISPVLDIDRKYKSFRSYVRTLLKDYNNRDFHRELRNRLNDRPGLEYEQKLAAVERTLHQLVPASVFSQWGTDNKHTFFIRLADELLRYNRIRVYMLENTVQFVEIEYQIYPNEMIVLENQLTPPAAGRRG
jgi:hypothetical protein